MVQETGVSTGVVVRLYRPVFEPERDFICHYELETEHGVRALYAVGIDGFQALQCAFVMLAAEVDYLKQAYGTTVIWLGHKSESAELDCPEDIL